MGKAFYICTRFAREALLWRAVEKKLQNKFGGLEIKFYLCTRFESRAANFRGRGFFRTGCTRHKKKIKTLENLQETKSSVSLQPAFENEAGQRR